MLALFPYPLIPSPLLLNRKLASHTIDEVFQFYVTAILRVTKTEFSLQYQYNIKQIRDENKEKS